MKPVNDAAGNPNQDELVALRSENARLKKTVHALMDRAERHMSAHGSSFNLFHTMIVLEDQVRHRTVELEASFRENERITRALRSSEEKYRTLINQSLVGFGIYEKEEIVFSNLKLAEVFGYSLEEMLLIKPMNLIAKNDRPIFSVRLQRALAGEKIEGTYVYQGVTKNNRKIFVELSSQRLYIEDRPSLIFTCLDITTRVMAEIEIRELNEKLRDMSIRDGLTGLFNRRYLDEMLIRELARAQRNNMPLTLIMGDIDHFKNVNDTYGHQAGDQILINFGELMHTNSRASDICCRYGGEEFLLICPDMTQESAVKRAEQLRIGVAASSIATNGGAVSITASFGVAVSPQHGSEPEELIKAADEALYRAKASGRNIVCLYSKE